MDFGKFDMVLLTTMSLSIILMSITFPALGLTDDSDQQGQSDVPEFNISSSQWSIAGDFPSSPATVDQGEVHYNETRGPSITGESLVWIEFPKENGTSLEMQNLSNQLTIRVNQWDTDETTGITQIVGMDEYDITHEGQTIEHSNSTSDWTIDFEVTELENAQESDMTATVEYDIVGAPQGSVSGQGFFDALTDVLAWMGSVMWWMAATSLEVVITLVVTLFTVMQYAVGMLVWLTTTYAAVVSAAGGFASAILSVPGVLLFLEFAKIAMLGIKLLPFT